MNPTADKLNSFIKEMSHYDPDNMEMGAKAVCELVLSGQLKLEDNKVAADNIRQAFIKQMQSDNYNVHAHAIRCIADMVPKLPSDQVEKIFSKIIRSIADKDLDQKKREIYGICAGTVIHQAAEQYGQKLSDLFVESVKQLMISKDQKNQIEVILINVISQFIRKWPRISANSRNNFDCNQLVVYLLRNVSVKSKLEIVKKSQTALGKVALILPRNLLETLFDQKDYGILVSLQMYAGKMDLESMKRIRNQLLCLANVLKTHNSQIKYWAKKISQILVGIIHDYKNNDNIDQIDLICDILDSSIICLSYLLKSYSRQLQQFLIDKSQCLSIFVQQLIDFNIEGQMNYVNLEDEAMNNQYQQGDDEYGYYDVQGDSDQKGWKVRRATLHYVTVLLKKDKVFKNKVSSSPEFISLLSNKLIETNSMVNEMAFQTFHHLIESISTQRNTSNEYDSEDLSLIRVKSTEKDLTKTIIQQINNKIEIILESSKFSDQLKIESNKIIYRLIQIFHQDLLATPALNESLIKILTKQLKKTQIIENKNYSLLSLKEMITRKRSFSQYDQILKQTIKLLKNPNLKVSSTAYKCLKTFINVFPQELLNSQYFVEILTILKSKIKQHDADKVIKQNVIKCIGCVFEHYIHILKSEDERQILQALNTKLKIEIQKSYILEQINKIPSNYKSKTQNIKLYRQTLQLVSNNLGSSNAELNFQVIETTGKVMKIIGENLDNEIVDHILNKTKPIFSEYKIPEFLETIINLFPSSVKPYAEAIIKSTESKYIFMLIEKKIVNQSDCIHIFKSIEREDSGKNISLILAKIGISENQLKSQVNESKWGLVCLGALGYVGGLTSAKYLTDNILNNKNQQFRLQAAGTLGNIASRFEESLIPEITSLAQKSGDFYIFIFALREYLNFKIKNFLKPSQVDLKLTDWLFKKSQGVFEGQSVYHLISQCVGKLAFVSNNEINSIVKYATSNIQNHRFVVANSLRFYFIQKTKQIFNENVQQYTRSILYLIGDKSAIVRCSATKSLNAITELNFYLVKPLINKEFWTAFKHNLHYDLSLIIEVDYGISKEKKDLGRPLRVESFNLLKFLLKTYSIDSQLVDQLMIVSMENINKQTNPDLVIKRLSCLRKLCQIDFTQFISHIGLFTQKIGIEEGVLKSYQNKAVIEDERSDVYLKSILKQIILINKQAEKQNIDQIRGYITTLKTVPRFTPIFESEDLKNAEQD